MHSRIPEKIVDIGARDIERVALLGSGVLELAGLRSARDIDLVMDKADTDLLLENDSERWHKKVRTFRRIRDGGRFQKTSIEDTNGEYDIWNHWYHAGRPVGNRLIYLDELIEDFCWQHKLGFWVVRLSKTIEMKAWAARPKDLEDVKLYEQFIQRGY